MSNLDQVWGATTADSNSEDNVTPPPGTYVVRIADVRAGTSKKGEQYFAIDLKDDGQGHKWMIYKAFTKNGQPHEGSIKSAKITLRQLGLDVPSPSVLEPALKSIVGRFYAVEVKASDRINQVTGTPYLNTDVTGQASAPTMVAPAAQAPPQVTGPTLDQAMTGQAPAQPGAAVFPPAVPGQPPTVVTPQQQQQAANAAANFGDNPGW